MSPNETAITAASSVVDLSEPLGKATFVYFVPNRSNVMAVALQGRESAKIITYDVSGAQNGQFAVPDFADSPIIRDVVSDSEGNVGLLKIGRKGIRVEVLDQSGRVLHEYPLKQEVQKILLTLRQVFALTDAGIIRVDDGAVFRALPKDKYDLLSTNSAKLVAISETLPLMYTFDLATNAQNTYVLKAPEIDQSIEWSKEKAPNGPRFIVFSAARDANGTFYGAISPYTANLRILKFDEYGHVTGRMIVRLPQAPGDEAGSHMDTSGGIACLGDRLLVSSRLKRKLAFYPGVLAPEGGTDTFVP